MDYAHQQLQRVGSTHSEDPTDPSTVQAMQIVLHLPKPYPPRQALLEASAQAVVHVCLSPEANIPDTPEAQALAQWYSHRIRKVVRRARNKAWEQVQHLPGVTVGCTAQARAFYPSAVKDVPPALKKLQIHGTDVPFSPQHPPRPQLPLIALNRDLGMSAGKAAAQAGHAAQLLAAELDLERLQQWHAHDFAVTVLELDSNDFNALAADAVLVQDAGFTEVPPGTITALSLWRAPGV